MKCGEKEAGPVDEVSVKGTKQHARLTVVSCDSSLHGPH